MIRTKTAIFCDRLKIEMNIMEQLREMLIDWNEADQDEVMLDAKMDVVNRMGDIVKEMRNLQSHQWTAVYEAQKALEKSAAEPGPAPVFEHGYFDVGEEAEQNG